MGWRAVRHPAKLRRRSVDRAGRKISAQAFTTNGLRYRVSANIKAVRQTYQYNFAGPFAGIATTTVHHHGFASTQEVGNESLAREILATSRIGFSAGAHLRQVERPGHDRRSSRHDQ